jgi:hypothetical protein
MKKITIDDLYKPKVIIIKDPTLQKIRNNLRNLWLIWANQIMMQLHNKRNEINHNEKGEFKSKLTGEEIEKVREVSELLNRVRELINKSICKCHRCARTDQDMKFNPRDKFWYCIECYDEMKKWTAKKKTGKSILFP